MVIMSVIENVSVLRQIVETKVFPLQLRSLWELGDYHYETIIPDLLLEFRINPFNNDKSDLRFTVSYYSPTQEDVTILSLPHFRTYSHKQLVTQIFKALAKEMFNIHGRTGKMIFDNINYYHELINETNSPAHKLAQEARDNFHRGYDRVKGLFKSLTRLAAEF